MNYTFIYGLLVGVLLAWGICRVFYLSEIKQLNFNAGRLQKSIYNRQSLYLGVLRREFFNGIFDYDTILSLDIELRDYAKIIENMNEQDFNREAWLYLIKEYPQIYDFDMIGDTHCIRYKDMLLQMDFELLKKYYLDIVKSKILLTRLDLGTSFLEKITDIESIKEKISEYDDERLGLLAYDAIRRKRFFYSLFMGGEKYEDVDYIVEQINDKEFLPTTRLGIYIKKTDEYAVYEVFFSDADEKTYESFYRSNKGYFESISINMRYKVSAYT